jgi:hypothetical protein
VQNGDTSLTFTEQGALELIDGAGRIAWSSGTTAAGGTAVFQSDGNLVVYTSDTSGVRSSQTAGHDGAVLVVEGDGNLVIQYRGTVLWQTHTGH